MKQSENNQIRLSKSNQISNTNKNPVSKIILPQNINILTKFMNCDVFYLDDRY